jgi:putative tryptophan/tyrosine transport system substrate-binding protein
MSDIRRRAFITLLGGALSWPLAARAQSGERALRRIGVLMAATADDPEFQPRMAAFQQGLAALAWIDGRNVRIDTRWAGTNAEDLRKHAVELAALAPDAILAGSGTTTVAPLLQATRTVPIVSVPVSLQAWRALAATPPASSCSNTARAGNGWRCSSRSRRGSNEWLSFGIPP